MGAVNSRGDSIPLKPMHRVRSFDVLPSNCNHRPILALNPRP